MQNLNRKTLIIIGVLAAVLVIGISLFLAKDMLWPAPVEAMTGEPVDVALNFYEPWLAAALSTSTDPYKEELQKSQVLSVELRKKLSKAKNDEVDPVLCNTVAPLEVAARLVSQQENGAAQVLVLSRDKNQTGQSIIDLLQLNDGWYINDITCSPGEFGPEREFSFDMEGFLLKSVPAPFNSQNWHLVFEQNGEAGHVVPLFFTPETVCIARDKKEAVCDPSTFEEASKAHIQGQMTETGVTVKRLEQLKK